jgi:hypothetical protein
MAKRNGNDPEGGPVGDPAPAPAPGAGDHGRGEGGGIVDQLSRLGTEDVTAGLGTEKGAGLSAAIVFWMVVGAIILFTSLSSRRQQEVELSVFAHFERVMEEGGDEPVEPPSFTIVGRVLHDGRPLPEVHVWTVVTHELGNEQAPRTPTTDANGEFQTEPFPATYLDQPMWYATVKVKTTVPGADGEDPQDGVGTVVLRGPPAGEGGANASYYTVRPLDLSIGFVVTLPAIFLLSIVVAFWSLRPAFKYYVSMFLAACITIATIVALGLGMRVAKHEADATDVISLGFGSIYFGSYDADIHPEGMFSLTTPTSADLAYLSGALEPGAEGASAAPERDGWRGFGAPLWVMLVAVIGAGLFTVSLIVHAISDRPDFTKRAEVREHIELIVRHQFYILFAPFGAIFVYQLLVVGDAAEQPVTVAVAALGAGASLNLLLEKALSVAKGLLKTEIAEETAVRQQMHPEQEEQVQVEQEQQQEQEE